VTDLSETTAAGAQTLSDSQAIAWPARTRARQRGVIEALPPHVIVLFGATGDLAKRKLLPGLGYLQQSRFTPDVRIVGTAMEDLDTDEYRALAKSAIESFGTHKLSTEEWNEFSDKLTYVPHSAGPEGLTSAVKTAEALLGENTRRVHYLSVPPRAAQAVIAMLRDADLVDNSRVIMEKPFGDDLETAIGLND
jgi:glucose-6-phosphate 1-dehydrogenase